MIRSLLLTALAANLVLFFGCQSVPPAAPATRSVTIKRLNYHGWDDSIVMSNGRVDVFIVPAIGRVMQFKFTEETDGPLWENREMDGKAPDAQSKVWGNFGGDKTWPAPQSDWPKVTPRSWPPPVAFDSMPVTATIQGSEVILTSPVDPNYGIRTIRRITLDPQKPVMKISTAYEKVTDTPQTVSIWTITQFKDPLTVCLPIPARTPFKEGYNLQMEETPNNVRKNNGYLSLLRNTRKSSKIGNDAESLVWIGEKSALRIDSARQPNADYPDKGSSAEVYTNPDPLPYVELELLGPLHTMKSGDKAERTNTYTLMHRTETSVEAEARKILAQ